jgi:hypothetical protein
MKKTPKATKLERTPRVLTANDLAAVGGGLIVNPLYADAGTSGSNPLWDSASVANNPIYKPSGSSGYNPLHAV